MAGYQLPGWVQALIPTVVLLALASMGHGENEPPTFTTHDVSTNVDGARCVFAVDLDADGDMDIITGEIFDDTISWYKNNGEANPTFTRIVISSVGHPGGGFAADMDGDGDVDIVCASYGDNTVAWYENNGAANPTFTKQTIVTNEDGAHGVFVEDMDGDGDMDIISASLYDDSISWYENNGAADPNFTRSVIATSANKAYSVFAADMDGDGDMDIVSASADDDTIAW